MKKVPSAADCRGRLQTSCEKLIKLLAVRLFSFPESGRRKRGDLFKDAAEVGSVGKSGGLGDVVDGHIGLFEHLAGPAGSDLVDILGW